MQNYVSLANDGEDIRHGGDVDDKTTYAHFYLHQHMPCLVFCEQEDGEKAMQLAETDGVTLAAIIHYKTSSHYHFLV